MIYSVFYRRKYDDEYHCVDVRCDSYFDVKNYFYLIPRHDDCKIIDVMCNDSHLQIYQNGQLLNSTKHKSTFDRLLKYYKNRNISVTIKEQRKEDEQVGRKKN